MEKKLGTILFFLTFLSVTIFSQTSHEFIIKGQLVDSLSGDFINDATLTVVLVNPDSVNGETFNEKYQIVEGKFNITLKEGHYYFNIYADGYMNLGETSVIVNSNLDLKFQLLKIVTYENFISGKIIDKSSNLPVGFANLHLLSTDSTNSYYIWGDSEGNFGQKNIKPGNYTITCKIYGYKDFQSEIIEIKDDSQIENYIIELEASPIYSNIIFNVYEMKDGVQTPVEEAAVYLSNADWLYMSSRHYTELRGQDTVFGGFYKNLTDNNGKAVFNDVVGHKYFVDIYKEGYELSNYDSSIVSIDDDNLEFSFGINKLPVPVAGIISGKIKTDDTNEPLMALVEFYKKSGFNSDSVENPLDEFYYYTSTYSNSEGFYEAKLDTGEYKIKCVYFDNRYYNEVMARPSFVNNIIEEYYDDVKTMDSAQVVYISENSIMDNISFSLDYKKPEFKNVLIKGVIKDENGHPINDAIVTAECNYYFYRHNFALTNFDGEYELNLKIIDSHDEVLRIRASKEGYTSMYYLNQPSWYLATPVIVKKSANDTTISDINISINKLDFETTYSVSGNVTDSSFIPLQNIYVEAYGLNNHMNYSTVTDSTGNYNLKDMIAGSYIISFYGKNYSFQFYDNKKFWEEAEIVNLDSDISGIDAVLTEEDFIECYDLRNSESEISGIVWNNNERIAGVSVILTSEDGKVNLSQVTDPAGTFRFRSIKYNKYVLKVSKVEYQSVEKTIEINGNKPKEVFDIDLQKSITNVNLSNDEIPEKFVLENNYPNPFNPSTTIKFEIPEKSFIEINVYNILGEKVENIIAAECYPGKYKVKFNAERLTSGIYFYTMETERIKITRKMILLK